MKILAIRFKNLNSLRKDKANDFFEINFQDSPLKDAGLFAITGATGAGKSTILDAICLALYGTAPRFGTGKAFDIMSRDTNNCFAEVTFEEKNKHYVCKWMLSKKIKRNKEVDYDEKMELSGIGGLILEANKLTEVKKEVEKITGLDYQRFMRSVLLSQGDFSAFLKADEKSRGELLEKITGSDIYSKLSKRADDKRIEEKEKLKILEGQIDGKRLLSEEQKVEIFSQIAGLQQKNEILKVRIETIKQQVIDCKEINRLITEFAIFQAKLQKLAKEKEDAKQDFSNLQKHEEAVKFGRELAEIETLTKILTENRTKINDLQAIVPSLRQEKETKEKEVSFAKENLAKILKEQEETLPIIEEAENLTFQRESIVNELDKARSGIGEQNRQIGIYEQEKGKIVQAIERQRADLKEVGKYLSDNGKYKNLKQELGTIKVNLDHVFDLGKEVNKLKNEIENKQKEISKQENAATQAKENLEKYKKEIANNAANQASIQQEIDAILQGKSLEVQEELYLHLFKNLANYRILFDVSVRFEGLLKEQQYLQINIAKDKDEETKTKFLLKELIDKQQHTEEKLFLAKQIFEKEKLIQSFEQTRQDLRTGEPCPVCGSEHHPLANYQSEVNEKEQQLNAYEKELKNIRNELRMKEIAAERLKTTIENQEKKLNENELAIDKLTNEFQESAAMFSIERVIGNSANLKDLLEAKKAEAEVLNEQNKVCTEKYNQLRRLEKNQKEQEGKYQDIEKQLIEINSSVHALQESKEKLAEDLARNIEKGKKAKDDLNQILSVYDEQRPTEAERENWFAKLSDKAAVYLQMIEKEIVLGRRIEEEKGNEKTYLAQIDGANKLLEKYKKEEINFQIKFNNLSDEIKNLFGDKDTKKEKERISQAVKQGQINERRLSEELSQLNEQQNSKTTELASKIEENTAKQAELNDKQSSLLANVMAANFGSLAEVTQALLSQSTADEIKAKKENLEKQSIVLNTNILQIEKALIERREKLGENISQEWEELDSSLKECSDEFAENNRIMTEFDFKLRENETLGRQFAEKQEQIEKQKREHEKWKMLVDIIGSKNTNELRSFAQSLTLSQLIVLANKHLEKLNPRYYLQKKEKTELDMVMIDREQADNMRPISTLSGGETFLVSLALALGLSDLATVGKKTQIQSLFIDEGFGTLDPHTLDETITTLENLQLSGKQIGIISHVEELKQRITTQILVSKKGNGVSQITVIS
ncbi:MAG: hypothetical protein EAZ08_09595 [Cytophagales bacterium]|nr:MAG: hypothetical protein EAZ08_09595 [Cytophagales bacterium]